ncbi:MAG: hypothetical protein U1F08_00080 [Steroidobacteraceae bacterium]
MSLTDPAISKKAQFTISLNGTTVVVTDEDGNKGGNVVTNGGRKVSFKNDTRRECWLTFRLLSPDDTPNPDGHVWPFSNLSEPADKTLRMAVGETIECKLIPVLDFVYLKYDITVRTPGEPTVLDPMIIVRPLAT